MAIILEKMNSIEFEQYQNFAIKNFAEEQIKSGNWEEQVAISKSKEEHKKLLPDGKDTENNHLFTIRDEGIEVGMIWLKEVSNKKGFIYDINIWKGSRGKGYGKQAMKEIETTAKTEIT